MDHKVEQALDKLKKAGIRTTPQRHAILSYMISSKTHPTADEIYKALATDYPGMSVATIYNNLKVFVECGLVRELSYGDNASRFDAEISDHYHAICECCGKISDFMFPPFHEVEKAAADETGFVVHGHRMEVYGICSECH